MGWARELWIESLGMPAVLPPPEEEKKVKTAIGAARAKKRARRRMLAAESASSDAAQPDDEGSERSRSARLQQAPSRSARQRQEQRPAARRHDATGRDADDEPGPAVNDDQDTLKAGERGPSLLEDFHFREKITHFDHERIPERVVHARGLGGPRLLPGLRDRWSATRGPASCTIPARETPVFVRFSTVAGSRGSTDLARDVRGFAVKFYTDEGNFDLVGNNMPVFFIQDAIKFPDLIHAVKPEPHNEIRRPHRPTTPSGTSSR